MLKYFFVTIVVCLSAFKMAAQQIELKDGTPLPNEFCFADTAIQIQLNTANATFSGCGVYQQNGVWFFNPALATQGISVFPYSCVINYVSQHGSSNKRVIVHKPVIIEPALKDQGSCDGNFTINATTRYAGAYDFQWQPAIYMESPNNSTTAGTITSDTKFYLTAIDRVSGCAGSDSVLIAKYPSPVIVAEPLTTEIMARERVALSVSGAVNYQWLPNKWLDDNRSDHPVAFPQDSITYWVYGYNEFNCYDSTSISIRVVDDYFIPNAFSPNNDGINDVFKIENIGYQGNGAFQIFNRLGQKVFEGLQLTEGWDGQFNGQPAPAGVYFYHIIVNELDGSSKSYKGDLTLIR